ncbi:hypothetical protein PVK06_003848 [Gossypium arboreum]|uniref:Uncharacterized protein n=1 Tax=Gossypium arboreum TaxID=29729 RepID=A0ABR0QQE9_GOSAR|nr:hypothetical protein PVK06_003848 [Gossypium arboreum]
MDGASTMRKTHALAPFTLIVHIFAEWKLIYSRSYMELRIESSTRKLAVAVGTPSRQFMDPIPRN